jgi:hypothetical protein
MTISSRIDSYLKTLLEQIIEGSAVTTWGGVSYIIQTDAGRLVDKGLEYTEHPDAMPSLVYYLGKNRTVLDESVCLENEHHELEISIEGFISDDKAGLQAEALQTDLAVVIKKDPCFGGLLMQMRDYSSEASTQIGDSVFSVVKVAFTAVYAAPFGSE